MDDTIVSEVDIKSKDDFETSKIQDLDLGKIKSENEHEINYNSDDLKSDQELTSSNASSIPISESSPLSICPVSLSDAGMLLESGDIIQHTLDGNPSIHLEDGTTAFVQSFEAIDESDSNDAAAKFIDGQAVQLEDGTTAFIHMAPREGLQAVQLEDGTMAYLSQTGSDLFNGEASELDLEQLTSSQMAENEEKELDIQLEEDFCHVNSSRNMDKAFQCPYDGCRRLYTTLHHLKVHERSHTGDRPFKCTAANCGKAFATGYGLKSHTRVHTGETPYKCQEELCLKAFKTSGDLQKHVRTHTGERPFKCPFNGCNRAFTTSNIRKVHIRTHTGERPYICKIEGCKRAFASATNYKNHIRIHTGEKPYVCSVSGCNKRFTEYSSLYKHHVVHTHSKPYTCNICSKNYRQTSTLAMHKRAVHGIFEGSEENSSKKTVAESKDTKGTDRTEEKETIKIKQEQGEEQQQQKIIVIKSANAHQEAVETAVAVGKSFPTIVTLQSDTGNQMLQEHPVYAVQVQQDGTLSTSMQQILLVTDSYQLATLQQLTQQAQLEGVLTAVNGDSTLEES